MKIKIKKIVEEDIKYLFAHLHDDWWDGAEISRDGGEFEEVDEDGSQIKDLLKPFDYPSQTRFKKYIAKDDPVFSMKIDVETGEVIGWPKGIAMNIYWKIVDEGLYQYLDTNDNIIFEYDGYVPIELAINDDGYGDYVILNIKSDGFIENWDAKNAAWQIEESIKSELKTDED